MLRLFSLPSLPLPEVEDWGGAPLSDIGNAVIVSSSPSLSAAQDAIVVGCTEIAPELVHEEETPSQPPDVAILSVADKMVGSHHSHAYNETLFLDFRV